jgi:hypothetical protein
METDRLKVDSLDAEITATLRIIELNFLNALEQVDRIQRVAKRYVQSAEKLRAFAAPWRNLFHSIARDTSGERQVETRPAPGGGSSENNLHERLVSLPQSMRESLARLRAFLPHKPRTADWGNFSGLLEDDVDDDDDDAPFLCRVSERRADAGDAFCETSSGPVRAVGTHGRASSLVEGIAGMPVASHDESSAAPGEHVFYKRPSTNPNLCARWPQQTDATGAANTPAATVPRHDLVGPGVYEPIHADRGLVRCSRTADNNKLELERFPEKFRDGDGARQLQQLYAVFCQHPSVALSAADLAAMLDGSHSLEVLELVCELLASRNYLLSVLGSGSVRQWMLAPRYDEPSSIVTGALGDSSETLDSIAASSFSVIDTALSIDEM